MALVSSSILLLARLLQQGFAYQAVKTMKDLESTHTDLSRGKLAE
jgi:hypothetical protein